jgi:hypothetical protein
MRSRANVYDCAYCKDAGIDHTVNHVPYGATDIHSTWGAGIATTVRQCSHCKRIDGPWVSADLVGGCW